jgi:hypothetical protein
MQVQVEIGFEQLVNIVKKLPSKQWTKLKQEVENETTSSNEVFDMETFLLTAPVFAKAQIEKIAKTRKAINQWRTK